MLTTPKSFCAISTFTCVKEIVRLIKSLFKHHPDAVLIIFVDIKTKEYIENLKLTIISNGNLVLETKLDKYYNLNRNQMTSKGIWSEFQMQKAEVIRFALESYENTLFLDSDIFILDKLQIDDSYELGASPHYMSESMSKRYGYYNGGFLYTNQKSLPDNWIKYTKTSRYYDQASIEDLAKIYKTFEFDETYNYGLWRRTFNKITHDNNKILYNGNILKCVHTHFDRSGYNGLNNKIKEYLRSCNRMDELLFI
jgi:hypothetical protein